MTSTQPWPTSAGAAVGDRKASQSVRAMSPRTPIEAATVWDAVSSREPKRRVVRSATTGAGSPLEAGKDDGKRRMPLTSAPRKP